MILMSCQTGTAGKQTERAFDRTADSSGAALLPISKTEVPSISTEAARHQTGRQIVQTDAARGQTERPFNPAEAQFLPAIWQNPLFFEDFQQFLRNDVFCGWKNQK